VINKQFGIICVEYKFGFSGNHSLLPAILVRWYLFLHSDLIDHPIHSKATTTHEPVLRTSAVNVVPLPTLNIAKSCVNLPLAFVLSSKDEAIPLRRFAPMHFEELFYSFSSPIPMSAEAVALTIGSG